MSKIKKKSFIFFLLFVFVAAPSFCQFQSNKEKYWIYRERLKNFIIPTELVSENGFDIPGRRREVKATLYGSEKSIELYLYLDTNDHQQNYKASQSTKQLNSGDSIRSHFAIKFNPIQWLWDDIRLMVEVPISKTNSLQFRVGYRNSKINPYDKCCHSTEQVYWNDNSMAYDTGRFACQGINWGIGMTHYIENKMYLNFSFLYKFYSYKFATLAGWTNPITDLVWTSDNELIHRDDYTKRVAGFEVRIGKIIELNRFGFDVFLGFGSRFRKRVVGDDNEKGSAFESDPSGFIDKNTTISINCGLNIFFNLKKIS